MALTVEDGTGVTNADSFVSEADSDTYHTNYGSTTAWDATTLSKEVLLRKATRWIDTNYNWKGQRVTADQALVWPRFDVWVEGLMISSSTVPQRVKDATAELALLIDTNDPEAVLTAPGDIKRKLQKVGPLTQDITYQGGASQVPRFPAIDNMLSEFVHSGTEIIRA